MAASCAGTQGRFWEMHDHLFANQSALDVPSLLSYGAGLGLDDAKYRACVTNKDPLGAVQADRNDSRSAELGSTPAFLIGKVGANGQLHAIRRILGSQPYSLFQAAIDEAMSQR